MHLYLSIYVKGGEKSIFIQYSVHQYIKLILQKLFVFWNANHIMAKVEIKKYCNLVFVQRAKKLSWMAGHQNRNLMRNNWDGSQWKCYLFSFNWLRLRLCSHSLIANSKTPKLCGGQSGSFWTIVTCIAKYFMMNNLWLLIFFSTLRIKFCFVDSFYLT